MPRRFVALALLLLLSVMPSLAQPFLPSTYHYFADYGANTRSLVANWGAAGESTFDLGALPENSYLSSLAIDRSGQRVAMCVQPYTTPPSTILIIRDIVQQVNLRETTLQAQLCSLGQASWSPDGNRLAAGIIYAYPWETADFSAPPQAYALHIFDANTLQIVETLWSESLPADTYNASFQLTPRYFDGRNVVFRAMPMSMEGNSGLFNAYDWTSDLGGLRLADVGFGAERMDYNSATGEILWMTKAERYTFTESILPFNYAANIVSITSPQGTNIVYHTATHHIRDVHFLPDGAGFVVLQELAYTDPTIMEGATFTPVYETVYVLRDGNRFSQPLTGYTAWPQFVWRDETLLTSNSSSPRFPAYPAQAATPAACPGLQSRLFGGDVARVTPGAANNLRELADASSTLVGQIPGGEQLRVLYGPQCDAQGRAWWLVEYAGLTGWTVEGQNGEYYIEPVLN